ncbi:MAG: hypothetical protein OQK29_03695 [Ignavibacteriaceae bacterium]|nr:hypothetical protein [Ignavibacteriaceae bacterium]
MISETYIYGEINKAIFKKNEKYFVLGRSSEGKFETFPLSNFELNDILLANPEVSILRNIDWDENKIKVELNNDIIKKEALNFFLMGMDTSLSNEIRKEAMEFFIEGFDTNDEAKLFVRNRVFGTKVPDSFNPISASEIAKTIGNEYLLQLYRNLSKANDIIVTIRNVWKKIILEGTFINTEFAFEYLDKVFTDYGFFADFVFAILTNNYKEIDNTIVNFSYTLAELGISGQPGVLLTKIKQVVFKDLSILNEKIESKYFDDIGYDDKRYEAISEDDFESKFKKRIEHFKGKSQHKRERRKGFKNKIPLLSRYLKGNVNDQVMWIKNKILTGNIKKAEEGILNLIEFQDFYSDKEHLCKSLCDIAETFQKINDIDKADLIAQKAINLNLNDLVPYCILAENLRAKRKLVEALKAYDDIIRDFKNDIVPRYGRAETLRQMGKLDEALETYDDLIKFFPYNQIAKTARIILLIQMDKNLHEVERELITSIPEAQRDWVSHHVYCMLLIKQNKLDEAIVKLKDGVDKVQDIISRDYYKNALSYAYIRKRQYDKAVSHLINESNLLPLPKVLVTHAYAADGNIKESKKYFLEIYNSQIKKVNETTRYISDRYQIQNKKFFSIGSTLKLDEIIDSLEFDLLTEYLIAA